MSENKDPENSKRFLKQNKNLKQKIVINFNIDKKIL
jgi:hypothetical protein